jgi:nucleoside-diphosphate-sugar epimerase
VIAELMGRDVEFVTDEQRMRPVGSEVERLWADNSRALELAGWRPEYGGLDGFRRGLEETIEWFTQADNLRRYKTGIYNV